MNGSLHASPGDALEQTGDIGGIDVWLWPDRLLLCAPGFRAERHRHHAIQLGLGLSGPVRLLAGPADDWMEAPGFAVPADLPHAFDGRGCRVLMLYLEPESAAGRAWRAAQADPHRAAVLAATPSADNPLRSCEAAKQRVEAMLGGPRPERQPDNLDPRIATALERIDTGIAGPRLRQSSLAAAVGVSSSHFGHLFSRQLGLPLRRYILWRRLRRAIEQAMTGASLTEAAHEAGFADSAHLSRTFRAMFGLPPALFFGERGRARVNLCAQIRSGL